MLLNYLNDDGFKIEPDYYIPVLPMLLINGSQGIGTGYSSSIPCFNPKDIIKNVENGTAIYNGALMSKIKKWIKNNGT